MITWRELMAEAAASDSLGSAVDARRIVERVSGWEGADHHLHMDDEVPARALGFYEAMVARRAAGEPLQYVVGAWGFRTLDLLVDHRVLIPRPETETVVEVALDELRRLAPEGPVVVDLGTGSGAIALSMAAEVAGIEVWATDESPDALAVARANLAGLGTAGSRVRLAQGDWFDALPAGLACGVDLIVSNPPYVAEHEVADLPSEVADHEPRAALVSGPTGLEDIAAIVGGASAWLAAPGALVVEIAPHQSDAAVELAVQAGFADAHVRLDLTGRLRALVARWCPR